MYIILFFDAYRQPHMDDLPIIVALDSVPCAMSYGNARGAGIVGFKIKVQCLEVLWRLKGIR